MARRYTHHTGETGGNPAFSATVTQGGTLEHNFTGLTPGQNYTFWVKASKDGVATSPSYTTTFATLEDDPDAPTVVQE